MWGVASKKRLCGPVVWASRSGRLHSERRNSNGLTHTRSSSEQERETRLLMLQVVSVAVGLSDNDIKGMSGWPKLVRAVAVAL